MDAPPPLLVRVKRARDAEPLPGLLVEEPPATPRQRAKRERPSASAAALRLVDSVPSTGWSSEDGLPPHWVRAMADAEWRIWSSASGSGASCGSDAPGSICSVGSRPPAAFREAGRRTVATGTAHGLVQMIDLVQAGGGGGPQQAPPRPPAFLVDGQALFVVEDEATSTATGPEPMEVSGGGSDDYVWDVYAVSDGAPPCDQDILRDPGSLGIALAQLSAPIFGEDFDDLEDIDDSASDDSGPGAALARWSDGGSSAGEDFDDVVHTLEKHHVGMLQALD